jgi:acetyl esterase/lipase
MGREAGGSARNALIAMIRYLVFCVFAALTAGPVSNLDLRDRSDIARIGLLAETGALAADSSAASCDQVSFTRNIRYGEFDQNVLDVAAASVKDTTAHPVLLFVAGESFAGDGGAGDASTSALADQAMCFAAGHGMVGVRISYRLAPAASWPAGAKDVAAAASWIHQNIDLYGGNGQEIVAIGYATGAFHVASFLAHRELQADDSDLAGAVLVSGIYKPSADDGDGARAYFGDDASKYADRSALPGLLSVQLPLMLVWSAADPPRLVTQGEMLKKLLCNSVSHCPRTKVLKNRETLASGFGPDASDDGLAELTLELVQEIEARGLP